MNLLNHSPAFQEGTRVLFLKGRYKDGIEKQRTITKITHDIAAHDRALRELRDMAAPNERIYGSAEARDLNAAAKHFKMAIVEADHGGDPLFWERLERRWESALMQPTSRAAGAKLWLFDCDNGEAPEIMRLLPAGTASYHYATKNGEHLITHGFDKRVLPPHLESIRNDNPLMLWGY